MSIYVDAIIPHRFTEVDNPTASLAELNRIKDKLQNHYQIFSWCNHIDYEAGEVEGYYYYGLELPNCFFIALYNGFIELGSSWRHSQYFLSYKGKTFLRNRFFDLVFALGKNQAFIASEYRTWNCNFHLDVDYGECAFDFECWRKGNPNIQDFDISMLTEDVELTPSPYVVVLDRFEDCWERLDVLRRRFPDCEILGISEVDEWYIPVLKEGKFNLIHKETGMEMPCDDVEAAFWPALS